MQPLTKDTGLRETPIDNRDLPLGAIFGHATLSNLPREFVVGSPLAIKDQGLDTDMCSAYALTAVAEDQDGVILDPLYTFARTKSISGDPEEWGANLRDACRSATKYGFLKGDLSTVESPANMLIRNDALTMFEKSFDAQAEEYKKRSYFSVNGPYDTFDNIRSALWQMRSEKRSVLTGALWRPQWTTMSGGVVDIPGPRNGFGHALKIFGWDLDRYLLAQLSNGKSIGDGGIFKISREAVNDAFTYGSYTFLDMPVERARYEVRRSSATGVLDHLAAVWDYWKGAFNINYV